MPSENRPRKRNSRASDVESRRLEGRFELASFDDYRDLLTSGGGRIRTALASAYRTDGGRLATPYEVVMAAGAR